MSLDSAVTNVCPEQDVTAMLEQTGNAIKALAKPNVSEASQGEGGNGTEFDPQERLANFKEAMDSVIVMLHSVDTRLKRQIYGLEEAGIITLPTAAQRAEEGGGGTTGAPGGVTGADAVKASLKPDGVGKIGNLDVGILNANSSTVERDMESELWTRLREHLERATQDGTEGDPMEF